MELPNHFLLYEQNKDVNDFDVDFLNAVGIAKMRNPQFNVGQGS